MSDVISKSKQVLHDLPRTLAIFDLDIKALSNNVEFFFWPETFKIRPAIKYLWSYVVEIYLNSRINQNVCRCAQR